MTTVAFLVTLGFWGFGDLWEVLRRVASRVKPPPSYHREQNCYRLGKLWGNYFLQPLQLPLPKNILN
eukprot:742365-Amphidinium_carterae.1